MDIGGKDLVINTKLSKKEQREKILLYFKKMWKCCIVKEENDDIFIFKDSKALISWNRYGRTDKNAEKMIYIICGKGQMTIVHEGLNEKRVINFISD